MDSVRASLKEKCLSVILENFERFFEAFKVSHGTVLGKLFEFLERAFSETLFRKLLVSDELEEKYLEFLINPHVHRLDLQGINEDLLPGLLKQLNSIENNIMFLRTAKFCYVEVDHYRQLMSSVPNAEVIEISDVIYPEVLEAIGRRCPALRVLKIRDCELTVCDLKSICMDVDGKCVNKPLLEHLDLSHTIAPTDGVSFILSHAPSLKRLEYSDTPEILYEKHKGVLENNSFENLKKYSLTNLSFPSWQKNILDTLKLCTVLCPDVTVLCINCLKNDEQLLLCSKFLHVKDLKISVEGNPLSFEGITQFLKLKGRDLFSIHLENGCVSAKAVIEHCPKLCSLKLDAVQYEPLDQKCKCLFSTGKLNCLKTLEVTRSNFSVTETSDSLKLLLSNAKNLNSLNFAGSEGLTENFIRSISQLGLFQVHELNLNSSDVAMLPVTDLLSHGNLKKLSVANCLNITEEEYFNLVCYRIDTDISINLNIWDEAESLDPYYEYDFEAYHEYDFVLGSDHEYYPDYDLLDYDCDYFGGYDEYDLYNNYDDYDDYSDAIEFLYE